jgi:hypothetical protein
MMIRPFAVVVLAGLFGAGIALAQTAPEPKTPGAGMMGHARGPHAHGMMMGAGQAMCGGMMPMTGMMGGPMGCPMMFRNVDVKVEKRDDGVGLILTSKDPATVRRLQKRAEIMRLMHELESEEPDDGAR